MHLYDYDPALSSILPEKYLGCGPGAGALNSAAHRRSRS